MSELKFKVGDRVRLRKVTESSNYGTDNGGLGTIEKVDTRDAELPYKVKWDNDTWNWAFSPDLLPATRTPADIKADIAALEAELAEATKPKFAVGDKVTVEGVVNQVYGDGSVAINVRAFYTKEAAVAKLTKVQQ